MSLREIKKQRTANEFMEAIKRIVNKEPKCKELKKKIADGKTLKLNPTNVEKEAGKSYNSTKSHKSVLDEIERINTLATVKQDASSRAVNSLKAEKKERNEEVKNLKEEIKRKNAEIKLLKQVNLSLHAHCRELTSALFEKIPVEEREGLFQSPVAAIGDTNIITFQKK